MASTVTLTGDWLISLGNKRKTFGTLNLGTYATNGIAVTPAQVGLGTIEDLQVQPAAGYVFEYDKANGKVKAYQDAGAAGALAEVGAVDITSAEARFEAVGY